MAKRRQQFDVNAIVEEYALIGIEAEIDKLTAARRYLQSRVRHLGSGTARIANPSDYSGAVREGLEQTQLAAGSGAVEHRQNRKRRRRAKMTPEQKKAVSERMKRYWAERRKRVDTRARKKK